jgi:hypothetical protein
VALASFGLRPLQTPDIVARQRRARLRMHRKKGQTMSKETNAVPPWMMVEVNDRVYRAAREHGVLIGSICGGNATKTRPVVAARRDIVAWLRSTYRQEHRDGRSTIFRASDEEEGRGQPLSYPHCARLLGFKSHQAVMLAMRAVARIEAEEAAKGQTA